VFETQEFKIKFYILSETFNYHKTAITNDEHKINNL